MVAYREWCKVPGVLLPAEYTAVRWWWGSNRIEWCLKGGSEGWSVQSAWQNNRWSARYVPSRYHEPRFTNVVHCYVLEKYRRSTLLVVRTRARPPLVTYVGNFVYIEQPSVFLKIPRKLLDQLLMVDLRDGICCSLSLLLFFLLRSIIFVPRHQ